jgi:hypothetical protein
VEIPQAEILGEYPAEGREPIEAHFPVLREADAGPTVGKLPKEPASRDAYSPSAAILRSRGPGTRPTDRSRVHAGLVSPVLGQTGPPLPLLLVAVFLLLALAL